MASAIIYPVKEEYYIKGFYNICFNDKRVFAEINGRTDPDNIVKNILKIDDRDKIIIDCMKFYKHEILAASIVYDMVHTSSQI